VASKKNILKYICSEKITHNVINEGCHIDFYEPNMVVYYILAFPFPKFSSHIFFSPTISPKIFFSCFFYCFFHLFFLFFQNFLLLFISHISFFSKFSPIIFLSTPLFSQKLKNKIFKKNTIIIKKLKN
jgi:hypothetical protein